MGKPTFKLNIFSGYGLAIIIFILAGGLIALSVWLIMKNTPPTTCDISVSGVKVASSPVNSTYPVTINYSGNGSNNCVNGTAHFDVTLTPPTGTPATTSVEEPVSKGSVVVQASDPKTKVSLVYYMKYSDGTEGPHHSY